MEHGVTMSLSDRAKDWLGNEGFDSEFGARPLRRVVQRSVENVLSRKILGGELGRGDDVLIDVDESGLRFERAGASVIAAAH